MESHHHGLLPKIFRLFCGHNTYLSVGSDLLEVATEGSSTIANQAPCANSNYD